MTPAVHGTGHSFKGAAAYFLHDKDGDSAERVAWKKALGRRPGNSWSTLNSMRNVEAGTLFRMAPKLKSKGEKSGE